MKLWYENPADNWNEALPIGNGRLGGMIHGGVGLEHIQLNEDSVWYGGPRDRNNPDTLENISKIRRLIMEGKISEANKLIVPAMSGIPENQRHYEPFADIEISTDHNEDEIMDYRRELDLERAVVTTTYTLDGTTYSREYFASAVDQVVVIRFKASGKNKINNQARLRRLGALDKKIGHSHFFDTVDRLNDKTVIFSGGNGGNGENKGISFNAGLRMEVKGGNSYLLGDTFIVEEADEVTYIFGGNTDFYHDNPEQVLEEQLQKAGKKEYEILLKDHINDYRQYYDRISFEIAGEDLSDTPTNKRLERLVSGKEDNGLINLYFNFGRYLLISCSRPGTQAATLQGIWNDQWLPPWDSKYTININLEMNYWPAEPCNLSELHQPLFDLIERMRENGHKTAKIMYDADGFCAHHNTDIWGDTAPQGVYIPASYWTMGAAWLCTHLWEHYMFNPGDEFLERAYPVMKDACKFFFDYLIEDEKGRLVTCPSVSPENTYLLPNGEKGQLCAGPSMDSQILKALLSQTVEAAMILGIDQGFQKKAEEIMKKLPKTSIGKHGQIMEWADDYDEAEPGHRHISHLWALFPGNEISPHTTPELAEAARVTLKRRLEHGGGHTGWSRAWIINFWARLYEGELAYENVKALLTKSTLPNLFDNHPPFQIDGNFGGTTGIIEMIMQSHNEEINLLPSIPAVWSDGSVKGIVARGGFEVDIDWQDGKLSQVIITSRYGQNCKIRYEGKTVNFDTEESGVYKLNEALELT